MPIEITLRTKGSTSPFRNRLKWLCSLPVGDRLILCSGYFQEKNYKGGYSILNDDLLKAIQKSGKITSIEIVGLMGSIHKSKGIRNFHNSLRSAGFRVDIFQPLNHKWHAKIAIRVDKDTPLIAIIGSSNLTRPPYGITTKSDWNYECDVTMWDDSRVSIRDFLESEDERAINRVEEFILTTDLIDSGQPSISDRLNQLLSEIRGNVSDLNGFAE